MATIGQQLLSPEVGWRRYDDTDSRILYYGGNWIIRNNDSNLYNNNSHTTLIVGNEVKFKFKSTKLRILATRDSSTHVGGSADVYIDEVKVGSYTNTRSTLQKCTLFFEIFNLNNEEHSVRIVITETFYEYGFLWDCIDIDADGYLLHPILNQVSSANEAQIGDCIPIHYTSLTSGQVGSISEVGTCIADEIPVTGTPTPNGLAYLIMVGYDYLGRKMFIPDRNLQTGISWDAINNAGLITGNEVNISNTKLLLHMDNSPFKDECGHPVNNNGVVLDTENKVFGNGSAYFNGSSYLNLSDNTDWHFGAGDFTIDCWVYPTGTQFEVISKATSNTATPYRITSSGSSGKWLFFSSSNGSTYDISTNSGVTMGNITLNTWQHLSVVRSGTTFYLFNNGVLQNTFTSSATLWDSTDVLCIGRCNATTPTYFQGYIDEVRISKGIARWTSNFTAPTSSYELEKDAFQEMRLLTGGISSTDTENEWDEIIVNSSLNSKITSGDNTVWHWNGIYSWASTTTTASNTNRIVRGNGSVNQNAYVPSSSVNAGYGFRPVLLVESDRGSNKFLIKQGDNYYSLKSEFYSDGQLSPLVLAGGEFPNDDDFKNNGIDDINDLVKVITTDSSIEIKSDAEILDEGKLFKFDIPDRFKSINDIENRE